MNSNELKKVFTEISKVITENKDYLIQLDQQNGDGDLGISMSCGFHAVVSNLESLEEKDLGKVFMSCSSKFNEAAPSSLGTILSLGMMGMAKALKGKEDASLCEIADAMTQGLEKIMDKAKSKPGEKTILDALFPAVEALKANGEKDQKTACKLAFDAAQAGSESTKAMKSVHGRAAYYGEKSIGLLDGGSVVGKLIFSGIYNYSCMK
jgi:dihydroxyacetone kinase-like protein